MRGDYIYVLSQFWERTTIGPMAYQSGFSRLLFKYSRLRYSGHTPVLHAEFFPGQGATSTIDENDSSPPLHSCDSFRRRCEFEGDRYQPQIKVLMRQTGSESNECLY